MCGTHNMKRCCRYVFFKNGLFNRFFSDKYKTTKSKE